MTYFDQTIHRVGFACKYMHPDRTLSKKLLEDIERPINGRTTTVKWLSSQPKRRAEERLWELTKSNINSVRLLIKYVATLPPNQRMVRIGSEVMPVYTHPDWSYFYQQPDVKTYCERTLAAIGDLAREHDVRVSMHPGQFCVLASDNPDTVNNSIDEFEYHIDIARMMGYGQKFMDMKVNVHIGGRGGPDGIRAVLPRLSTEARNCLTIENDEMSWGLDASLELANDVALVLDIHHHLIRDEEYIQANDDRFKRVIDSWRGVRPTIHYSVSREDLLVGHDPNVLPDMKQLLESGYKKAKLRAHSDMMWNHASNDWALTFLPYSDIMVESKFKNLASTKLVEHYERQIKAAV